MSKIRVKSYVRRSKRGKHGKGGKVVTVREYTRKVGRKGVKPPQPPKTVSAGEELAALKETKPKKPTSTYKGPYMTAEEIAAWDAAARKSTMSNYGERKRVKKLPIKLSKKRRNPLDIIDAKLTEIINRYS